MEDESDEEDDDDVDPVDVQAEIDESDDEGTFDHLPLSAMGNSSSASDPFGGTRLSLSSTCYSTIASGDVKIALADPTEKQKVVEPSVEKLV